MLLIHLLEVDPVDPLDPGTPDGSGTFAGIFVLFLVVGIGILVFKVLMARDLAKQSGLDPDRAAVMTVLSDDGLDATYLASSLRAPAPAAPAAPGEPKHARPDERPAADRLQELLELRDQGLITPAEHDARRAAIIDGI